MVYQWTANARLYRFSDVDYRKYFQYAVQKKCINNNGWHSLTIRSMEQCVMSGFAKFNKFANELTVSGPR